MSTEHAREEVRSVLGSDENPFERFYYRRLT